MHCCGAFAAQAIGVRDVFCKPGGAAGDECKSELETDNESVGREVFRGQGSSLSHTPSSASLLGKRRPSSTQLSQSGELLRLRFVYDTLYGYVCLNGSYIFYHAEYPQHASDVDSILHAPQSPVSTTTVADIL